MPKNVQQQDIRTLVACEEFLNQLALRENLLWGQTAGSGTALPYLKWEIRLEDTIDQIARFRRELENRLTRAVADRLEEPPLPTATGGPEFP